MKKKIFLLFSFVALLYVSFPAAVVFPENVDQDVLLKPKNVSPGDFVSADRASDRNKDTAALLPESAQQRNLILDLGAAFYLDMIKLYLGGERGSARIGLSTDMLNWQEIPAADMRSKVAGGLREDTFNCAAAAGRYIRLIFPGREQIAVNEIEIYPSGDYALGIHDIQVTASDTKATITFDTDREASAQLIYDYNYNFVYEKELRQTMLEFTHLKKHIMVIPALKPQTSYRFQIRATDYLNKMVQSDFILFTTRSGREK